ncbi:hypothetical protein [Jiangella muralis]|uniref:hypothetical protein n=1 Tax=Jiangella muralis TaxID=702383 RepID=UPI00069E2E3F|nr:hypothetical protein [Jiangella muralis]
MSTEERQQVHEQAADLGIPTSVYVLALVDADRKRRASVEPVTAGASVTSINSTQSEAPGPVRDRAPNAKARRAVTAAAG